MKISVHIIILLIGFVANTFGQLSVEKLNVSDKKVTFYLVNKEPLDFVVYDWCATQTYKGANKPFKQWFGKDTLYLEIGRQGEYDGVQISNCGGDVAYYIDGVRKPNTVFMKEGEKFFFEVDLFNEKDNPKINIIALLLNKNQVIYKVVE